jgi:hypothetical protein
MTKWARESKENERAFWTGIYPKLLPLQVAGDQDNPRQNNTVVINWNWPKEALPKMGSMHRGRPLSPSIAGLIAGLPSSATGVQERP